MVAAATSARLGEPLPLMRASARSAPVAPDGTRTVVVSGLIFPTSIVIGPDGAIYVTNCGTSIGLGEVLRIES